MRPAGRNQTFCFLSLLRRGGEKMVRETKVVMKLTEEKNEWESDFPLIFFVSWKIRVVIGMQRRIKKKKKGEIIRQNKKIYQYVDKWSRKNRVNKNSTRVEKEDPSFIQNITREWKSIRFSRTVELYKTNPVSPYAWRNSRYFITHVAFSVFNITAPLRARFLSLPRRNVSSEQEMHSCCNDIQKNFSPRLGAKLFA